MGKLFIGILVAATGVAAIAAPAWAIAPDSQPSVQPVYLRETQQVTGRADILYKLDNGPAVEGKAEMVEYSKGLVVYEPAVAPATGQPAVADLQVRPVSPVQTTTTTTVHWAPAKVLPTPHSF
jgi:hypothetical protein